MLEWLGLKAAVPPIPKIKSIDVIDASGFNITINKSSEANYYVISVYSGESLSNLVSGSLNGIEYGKIGGITVLPKSNEFSIDVRGLASGVYYFFSVSAVNLEGISPELIDRIYVGSNRSTGIFKVNQILEGANHVDAGDIDGDGDTDIVGLDSSSGQLSWWSNDGGNYATNGTSIGIVSADKFLLFDADRDGDIDIVCGYKVPNGYFFSPEGKEKSLALFMNDGSGNFTESSIPTNSYLAPVHIKSGDMDGDGFDDIVIANAWDRNPIFREIYFVRNGKNFSGGDFNIPHIPFSIDAMRSLTDVDGMYCIGQDRSIHNPFDIDKDIFSQHISTHCWLSNSYDNKLNGKLVWLKNKGDGMFEKEEVIGSINISKDRYERHNPRRYLYGAFDIGDIDMDGDMDVVAVINPEVRDYNYASSWYVIYRNDRVDGFSEEVYRTYRGLLASRLKLEDLDGSSALDFVVGLKEPDGYESRYGYYYLPEDSRNRQTRIDRRMGKINYKAAQFWNVNSGESFDIAHKYQLTRYTKIPRSFHLLNEGIDSYKMYVNDQTTVLEIRDFDGDGDKDYATAALKDKSIHINGVKVDGVASDLSFVSGRALDIDGDHDWDFVGGTSKGDTFLVIKNRSLNTPSIEGPTDITNGSFTARWNKIKSDDIVYVIQVSEFSDFNSLLAGYDNLDVGDVDSYVANGLSPSTQYYYRVRAKDMILNDYSGYSAGSACITAPDRVDALVVSTFLGSGFFPKWSLVFGDGYELEVSNSNDFSSSSLLSKYDPFVIDDKGITSILVVDDSDVSKSYYYRVRAYVSGIVGDISDSILFGEYSDTVLVLEIPTILPLVKSAVTYTVSWSVVSSAESYELEVSDRYDFSESEFFDIVDNTKAFNEGSGGLSVGELVESGSYYYRVRSKAGVDNYSFPSEVGIIVTSSSNSKVPVALPASKVGYDSLTANWSEVSGDYKYELSIDSDFNFAGLTVVIDGDDGTGIAGISHVVDEGLTEGTIYYYRVRSRNSFNVSSGYSNKVGVLTLPGVPEVKESDLFSASGKSFRANWSPPSDPNAPLGYDLEISMSDKFSVGSIIRYSSISDTSLILGNLEAGDQYYYRVRSVNRSGVSVWSGFTLSPFYPISPMVVVSDTGSTEFTISWVAVTGADGYRLSVSLVSDFGCCLEVDAVDVSDTSYNLFDLVPGSRYYYRVSSLKNIYQYASDLFVGSVLLYPSVPILRDSRYAFDGIELRWRYTSVSDSALLQVSRDGAFSDLVAGYSGVGRSVVGASIVASDIGSGIGMYYYRVASVNATGMSEYSESKSFINIAPPSLLGSSGHREDGFRINWELDDGIDSVLLEVSSSRYFRDNILFIALSGDSISYVLSGLFHSRPYYYRVRSKEGEYVSFYSEVGESMTLPPYIRSLGAVIIGSRSYVARWVSSSGDISYELDVSKTVDFVSYDVAEIDPNESRNYYDIVFADTLRLNYAEKYEKIDENDVGRLYNTSYESYMYLILSEDKNEVLDTISLSIPSLYYDFDGIITDALDVLNLYYDDFISLPSAHWVVPLERIEFSFYSLDSGFHNVGGLEPGEDYYYRIRSRNSSDLYSRYSEVVRVVTLPEVMALPATEVSNNGFVANWRGIGVSGYRLEVSTDLSFQRPLVFDNLDSMSHYVGGLVSGIGYYYRVIGYNEVGNPSYGSNIISVSSYDFAGPIALPATFIRSNSFRAHWTSEEEDVMHALEVSVNGDFDTIYDTYYSEDTFLMVTDLFADSEYYYRVYNFVRENSSVYYSTYSNVIKVRTLGADTTMMDTTGMPIMTGNDAIVDWECDIYPNPMNDDVYIDLINDYRGELSYRVHSSSGSVVLSGIFYKDGVKLSFSIDVSVLSPGAYIVELTMGSGRNYYKVLKD